MVRTIGIALVILGLIAQPLTAAVPDFMPIGETSSSTPLEQSELHVGKPDHSSQAPCHETASPEAVPEACTDCDSECANGACASTCSVSTLAVLNPTLFTFKLLSPIRQIDYSVALVQELPSRIFHPPKHA